MIKKRLFLLIIFSIFVVSSITLFMILNYLDPYAYGLMAIVFLLITFLLSVSCFVTILLYIIKKIHYRWDVFIYHILTSFRQWFFTALFIMWLIILNKLWANLFITGILLFAMFVFLDLFLKNIKS